MDQPMVLGDLRRALLDKWADIPAEHPQWASYQIRKIAGCACAGNAGKVFPRRRLQMKRLVSDPGMHHGTCVTHVPRCMSGSFACGDGENVPGIPGACASASLRIWQEAHAQWPACVKPPAAIVQIGGGVINIEQTICNTRSTINLMQIISIVGSTIERAPHDERCNNNRK